MIKQKKVDYARLIPPQRKLAAFIFGCTVFAVCAYHLLFGDVDLDGWNSHDVIVGIIAVVGAGIAFPDPVVAMIMAWKGKKD